MLALPFSLRLYEQLAPYKSSSSVKGTVLSFCKANNYYLTTWLRMKIDYSDSAMLYHKLYQLLVIGDVFLNHLLLT